MDRIWQLQHHSWIRARLMIRKPALILLVYSCLLLSACASLPKGSFDPTCTKCPDYSLEKNWAALPFRKDSADAVPVAEWQDVQDDAPVDVFFIHPTTYTGKAGSGQWNADVDDPEINSRTDRFPIRYQASIFNGCGRVYAPRYRQAHLQCFYKPQDNATKALELAYEDVRNAFEYYLEHYNQGRPFILAAHSQGTFHASRLIKELIDGKPLQQQMIVAYIVGFPVLADHYQSVVPCRDESDLNCFCSWRTVREGSLPEGLHFPDLNIAVTNPVTWTTDTIRAEKSEQIGAVLRDFYSVTPDLVSAQVHKDFLWVSKPKFPGSILLATDNYHIADYNFFYADVRKNAQERVKAYLQNHR